MRSCQPALLGRHGLRWWCALLSFTAALLHVGLAAAMVRLEPGLQLVEEGAICFQQAFAVISRRRQAPAFCVCWLFVLQLLRPVTHDGVHW